jgi:hypothetical protein
MSVVATDAHTLVERFPSGSGGGWPLRPLPQSASLLQLPATTLTLLSYRVQIPTPIKLGPRLPLLANSATKSGSSARVCRLGAETFCSSLIRPRQRIHLSSNRCVGQTLTIESPVVGFD